jgi:hypothetical protein
VLAVFFFLSPVRGGGAPAPDPAPAELKPSTVEAFDRYVRLTEARNDHELKQGNPFLRVDALPEAERAAAYAALKRGEVKIERLETRENGAKIHCPDGLIHHWAGIVFIPGASLDETLALLEDYDHHSIYYAPDVQRSKIEQHDDDHFRVFLRFKRKKIITVVLNTIHEVRYSRDDAARAHSRSSAVRIAEVEHAGERDEREKIPGDDGGYLWRMETWWRMEERDGGTYVQSEVVSLTRDIPVALKWLIGPFVTSIPRETLAATLEATRKGVAARRAKPARASAN